MCRAEELIVLMRAMRFFYKSDGRLIVIDGRSVSDESWVNARCVA